MVTPENACWPKETYIITNKPYLCKQETDAAIATDFRILPEFRANES